MPSITLRAEDDDGTTLASVSARSAEKTEPLVDEMDRCRVVLAQDSWETLDAELDRVNDHLVVTTNNADVSDPFFAGRFDADERSKGTVEVDVVSYERDAKDAQPTQDNVVYQNVEDSQIVTDLLDQVATLEAGMIETLATNLSMTFSHAELSKALRDVAEATGGELRYNFDRTVDYVDRRGALAAKDTATTVTFDDTGEQAEPFDVSNMDTVVAKLDGAAGRTSGGGTPEGGRGGYVEAKVDVSEIDTLHLYPGEMGVDQDGGWGLYSGGDANTDEDATPAGGGGGSTSITDGEGTELLHADGGGGHGNFGALSGDYTGGGGGARGGEGGAGKYPGEDAEGVGFGGDGGGEGGTDGDDGGVEAVDDRVTILEQDVGGGSDDDGSITITRPVTLTPETQTILDEPDELDIVEDAREEISHVRGFGAQNGPDQVTAEAVADSFEEGQRQIWREYENKNIVEADRLQRIVDQLVDEYDGEPRQLTVQLSTSELALGVGDEVHLDIPAEGINRQLRIMERRTILGTVGAVLGLTVSNRKLTTDDRDQSNRKDLQRFNRGYQGFVDRSQITSGWDNAGDGVSQELVVANWPDDVVDEKLVELTVQGRAWRSPISVPQTSEANEDFENVVASESSFVGEGIDDASWTTLDSFSPAESTSELRWSGYLGGMDGEGFVTAHYRLRNLSTGENIPGTAGFEMVVADDEARTITLPEASDVAGETVAIQMRTASGEGSYSVFGESWWVGLGTHIHDIEVQPTVIDEFDGQSFYAADVDIEVNGQHVETLSGDLFDSWSETIDIAGELTPGENTITATPSDRGELNLILSSELFRRGRSE